MSHQKYTLLLNDSLKKHMLRLNRKEKDRLREKFEFLEAGIWDSGIRVKKLKGLSGKVIFEARLSKGDRLIFTLGKQSLQTGIYVWGFVKHDDVSKSARHIFPGNAPFLYFEPEITEEYPDVLIDDLPETCFSQEAIEEKSPDDHGPQKWLVLDDDQWQRMLLASDTDPFETFLYLTSDQRKVLETDPPLLLSGTAGSGKTTISVYYLLKKGFLDKRRLFLTYSPYLNEFSKKIYWGLISKTGYERSDTQPDFYVFRDLLTDIVKSSGFSYSADKEIGLREFKAIFRNHRFHQKYDAELVWEEIRAIIKGAKPSIQIERFRKLAQAYLQHTIGHEDLKALQDYLLGLVAFEFSDKIERIIQRKGRYPNISEFAQTLSLEKENAGDEQTTLFNEVLKVMEKKAKSFTAPLLTYQEYVNLGKKRAPNFIYERKDIYDIAAYYQSKLEAGGLWDEIDLCKQALRILDKKQGTSFGYDLVVCDELQDFTDIQLSLIFRLAKSHRGLILTGDPKQIINPSGFRWEEVKNKFYERNIEIPDVYRLNLNFRCVGNIVRLSNALIDLKGELIGLSGGEQREEWKFNGRPPFLLTGFSEEEILDGLDIKGAGQIILVRDKQAQSKLRKRLGTELIFTIHEAKGLEFDTVLLWKFSSDKKSADIWRKIKNGDYFDRRHYPHINHEISLLYVAITRARNTLIVFDSSNDIWNLPGICDLIHKAGEKEILSEIWQRVSTPEEWERQGDYFFEREHYPAAAECYKNAGRQERYEVAYAYVLEGKGHVEAAARFFEKHGSLEKAAECYQHASLFDRALPLWESVGKQDRIITCRIRLYEQNGEFNRAADELIRLGDFSGALENWKKGGNHHRIAEYFISTRDYHKAALAFETAGDYSHAASCYQKARHLQKAADLFYQAGDFDRAIPLFKKLRNRDKLLLCYVNNKAYYPAALLYEKGKEIEKAIEHFRKFAGSSEENRQKLLAEAEKYDTRRLRLKAAIRLSACNMPEKAGPMFYEKRFYETALAEFRGNGDYPKAAECYERLGDFYRAALEYEKSDAEDKWEKTLALFQKYAVSHYEKYGKRDVKLYGEAESYYEKEQYEKALVRYKAIHFPDKAFDVYMHLMRDEEALGYFMDQHLYDHADRYLENKETLSVSSDFVQSIVSKHSRAFAWYPNHNKEFDVVAKLLVLQMRKNRSDHSLETAVRFLSSFSAYGFFYADQISRPVLDLTLEVPHYNAILEIMRSGKSRDDTLPESVTNFAESVKQKAEENNDPGLFACYSYLKDKSRFEDFLGDLDVTAFNCKLFAESAKHFRKAVRFNVEKKNIEEAASVCRRHDSFDLAGKIYEDSEEYVFAARSYRDGRLYEDALRCYKQVGDDQGVARIYERMNEFNKALAIWKRLGKSREIQRVQKKKQKATAQKRQLKLF